MAEHADFEALSAYVDGEAPEWADHVAACPSCRASADEVRAVARAVGGPVEPAPAVLREAAISAALGGRAPEVLPFERRRPERRWAAPAMAAAAAVVALVLGLSVLVSGNTRSSDETATVGGPAPEAASQADASKGSAGARDSVAAGDLGDVPDAATLLARARPGLSPTSAGSTGVSSSGAAAAAPSQSLASTPPARAVVGTRPCEEQARAREPALREVVYFATARRGNVPAVVLGFATGPAPSPVTLLLLAQDGCSELLRTAGP